MTSTQWMLNFSTKSEKIRMAISRDFTIFNSWNNNRNTSDCRGLMVDDLHFRRCLEPGLKARMTVVGLFVGATRVGLEATFAIQALELYTRLMPLGLVAGTLRLLRVSGMDAAR